MLASPRRPLQPLNTLSTSPARDPDLYCYEAMPVPSELAALASIAQTRALAPLSPSAPSPPISPARACPAPCSDGLCWCLDPCVPDRVCTNHSSNLNALSRKRRRSPSPPAYQPGDRFWTQAFRLFHPTDFEYTTVEMDSNRPLRAIFHQLCADQRVQRKDVTFVWIHKRSTNRVQQVRLSDESVPWAIGMKENVLETIECEFV